MHPSQQKPYFMLPGLRLLDSSGFRSPLNSSNFYWKIVLVSWFLVNTLFSFNTAAEQRPLLTKTPTILSPGKASLEFGLKFLQNAKFPVSGLRGDKTSLGVMGLNFSLGKMAEVQTEWTAYNFLSVTQASSAPIVPELSSNGKATSDFGDIRLSTKILMIPESAQTPSFGVFTSVELPNASTNKGLGLNSTQYRGGILLGKHWGQLHAFGNLGLGILSNPVQAGSQNDVALYGLGGIYTLTEKINIAGEIFGRWSTRRVPPVGTESLSQLSLGLQIYQAGLRWDIAGSVGLTELSPKSGIIFGLTKEFDSFFHRKK